MIGEGAVAMYINHIVFQNAAITYRTGHEYRIFLLDQLKMLVC